MKEELERLKVEATNEKQKFGSLVSELQNLKRALQGSSSVG